MNKRIILNEHINFPFMLAPMVGLTHVAFRMMLRQYLPEGANTIWPTEMLNSKKLPEQVLGETPETFKGEGEDFLVPQILGNKREYISKSLTKLEAWGAAGVDINMGCPVSRALKHNYGVSLMGDASYAKEVVQMTVESASFPVSVKLRAGLQKDEEFLIKFVKGLEQAGASWICLHPRTAEQKRRGNADWSQIKLIRDELTIPVVGNGDIQILEDAMIMIEQTSCDGVMIGRALCARPWLLWQIGEKLGFEAPAGQIGKAPSTPEEEAYEYGRALLSFFDYCVSFFEEKHALRRIRFFVAIGHVWINFGLSLNCGVNKNKDLISIRAFIVSFFEKSGHRMSQKTQLRD